MGQYHYVANYDKRQFLHPHKFDDGLKLLEFGCSRGGTLQALAVLLAASNTPTARGGGDLHPWIAGHGAFDAERTVDGDPKRADWLMLNVVGSWAGDRIAIIGDYAEPSDASGLVEREGSPWHNTDDDNPWTDISALALEAMLLDFYTHEEWKRNQAA